MKPIPQRALAGVLSQPWAIQPEWLKTITEIVQRHGEDPAALALKLGRPLEGTQSVEVRDRVAVLPVTGPIFPRANVMTDLSGATSLEILARDFTQAQASEEVDQVLLDFDSPGGLPTGLTDFVAMMRAAEKPVTAFIGGLGASAAYWIAAAADQVVLSATAEVGSIGVAATVLIQEQPDQDGFREFEIVSSNAENKRPDPRSDEGLTEILRRIDAVERVFIADVAASRGVAVETVLRDFGRGGLLMGTDAVAAGMADRVGTFEDTLAGLASGSSLRPGGRAPQTRSRSMAKMTAAEFAAQHPEAAEELRAAAHKDGVAAGAAAARKETAELAQAGADKLVKEAAAAAKAEGLIEGAQAERDRIAALKDAAVPGYEALLEECIADGTSTAAELALKTTAAIKAKGGAHLGALKDDKKKLDEGGGAPNPTGGAGGGGNGKDVDPLALSREAGKLIAAEAKEGRSLGPDEAVARVLAGEAA